MSTRGPPSGRVVDEDASAGRSFEALGSEPVEVAGLLPAEQRAKGVFECSGREIRQAATPIDQRRKPVYDTDQQRGIGKVGPAFWVQPAHCSDARLEATEAFRQRERLQSRTMNAGQQGFAHKVGVGVDLPTLKHQFANAGDAAGDEPPPPVGHEDGFVDDEPRAELGQQRPP
jgi:hypothetical protein